MRDLKPQTEATGFSSSEVAQSEAWLLLHTRLAAWYRSVFVVMLSMRALAVPAGCFLRLFCLSFLLCFGLIILLGFGIFSSWPRMRHMRARFQQSFPLTRHVAASPGREYPLQSLVVQFRTMIHDITPLGDALTADLKDIFAKAGLC